jgi:Ca-activated chloride channel homolog
MRQGLGVGSLLIVLVFAPARREEAQTNGAADQSAAPYRLSVSVDEVILTFHAADARGLPVNDLKLDELTLLDNGKPPGKILDFQLQRDFPIRAGIIVDTSDSMRESLPRDRAIAIEYAQRMLRQQTDQAFVTEFGRVAKPLQIWTSDPAAVVAGVRGVSAGGAGPAGGTAIFDTLLRACLNEFGRIDHNTSGNFILLFSDGEENASYASLKDAVDMCQRSNTAIYAFRAGSKESFGSTGPPTLAELAAKTGGRVFLEAESDANIYDDLRFIEANLRNQYRIVFRPAELKHDGEFHAIALETPDRVASTTIRSGYYAPKH